MAIAPHLRQHERERARDLDVNRRRSDQHVSFAVCSLLARLQLHLRLQQASFPPDVRAADVPPEGSPSFRRWAGLEGPNRRAFGEEMRKYVGPTVATLRVLVQNRRTDGRVVAVVGGETVLSVSSIMKDNLLPEEQSRVRFQPLEGR